MPLVPRHLRPRSRIAAAARKLPVENKYRAGIEKNFAEWRKKIISSALASGLMLVLLLPPSLFANGTRLRDLVMISGARDNQLVGYGLVAGLAGDGD